MTTIAERDETIRRLRGCLDIYTAANTEALKAIAGLYAEAEDQRAAYGFLEVEVAEQIAKVAERDATIARVKALADSWGGFGDKNGFRSTMVFAAKELRTALKTNKLTVIDTKGESRHA